MTTVCPGCNRTVDAGKPHCLFCGTPLRPPVTCAACGKETPSIKRTCLYCGAALALQAPTPTTAPQPAPQAPALFVPPPPPPAPLPRTSAPQPTAAPAATDANWTPAGVCLALGLSMIAFRWLATGTYAALPDPVSAADALLLSRPTNARIVGEAPGLSRAVRLDGGGGVVSDDPNKLMRPVDVYGTQELIQKRANLQGTRILLHNAPREGMAFSGVTYTNSGMSQTMTYSPVAGTDGGVWILSHEDLTQMARSREPGAPLNGRELPATFTAVTSHEGVVRIYTSEHRVGKRTLNEVYHEQHQRSPPAEIVAVVAESRNANQTPEQLRDERTHETWVPLDDAGETWLRIPKGHQALADGETAWAGTLRDPLSPRPEALANARAVLEVDPDATAAAQAYEADGRPWRLHPVGLVLLAAGVLLAVRNLKAAS